MTTVQEQAGLHESTVKDAHDHVGRYAGRKTRASSGRSSRIQHDHVNELVMAEARKLQALRPGTRIRVVDSSTVIVE